MGQVHTLPTAGATVNGVMKTWYGHGPGDPLTIILGQKAQYTLKIMKNREYEGKLYGW